MTYKDIWQSLENSAPKQTVGYIRRRIKPSFICDLFLAVARPSNQHMLQMRLSTNATTVSSELPTARGLDIALIRSEDGYLIQLALGEQRFTTIFDALIHDVVEFTTRTQSESAAIAAFVSRLRHWQKFLERVGPDGLSREAQQGLYGELWFLREYLIPFVGLYPAVMAWAGPSGAHQDFVLGSCAIEVKTTGSKEPQQIIIQSERQLDDTGLPALFLFHVSLDVRDNLGESLIVIINSLRQLLKDDPLALELYEDRLLEAGFLQAQTSMYEKAGYIIRRTSLFQVKDTFPRIVEADLKPGVGAVRYSIAVAECRHFAINEEELTSLLVGLNYGK